MILIVNHKANFTYKQIIDYEKKIRKLNIIILPTSCYLPVFKKGKYILGSQDVSIFKEKNRTGEINAAQLSELNVQYCLIGHNDRRCYNYENQDTLLKKIKRCYENNITPIYCIGETNIENYKEEIINEIELFFKNFNNKDLLLVYEPRKNIGNLNADLSNVEEIINFIKTYIKEKYNQTIKIIYGGGVNINNIEILRKIKDIDGLIISTEALNIDNLNKLYKETKK